MAAIDIGYGCFSAADSYGGGLDNVKTDRNNPSNGTGFLTTGEVQAYSGTMTNCRLSTLYGSSASWAYRDSQNCGSASSGSKTTFTGINIDVSSGDILGIEFDGSGRLGTASKGPGADVYYRSNADWDDGSAHTYTLAAAQYAIAIYATGTTIDTPTVTTQSASSVISIGFTGNGNVTSNGGAALTEKGICYKAGESGDPTTSDSTVHDHTDSTGAFTENITGLKLGTGYRARAYAINSAGTGYGTTVQVITTAQNIVGWVA